MSGVGCGETSLPAKRGRKPKTNDAGLHAVIAEYVKLHGVYNIKLGHLKSFVAEA